MASKKEINDFTTKSTLDSTDEIVIQETGGGTTKKTTFSSFLVDTLQAVFNRGKSILLTDETDGELKIKDSNTNSNRTDIIQILDKDDNVVFAVDKDGISAGAPSAGGAGAYSPSFTNQVNISYISNIKSYYQQIGSIVFVTAYINIRPTAALTGTDFEMSLPVASNFTTVSDGHGDGFIDEANHIIGSALSANDTMFFTFISNGGPTGGQTILRFSYIVK